MKLDKMRREDWKLAGITLVTAIITGWALDSILMLRHHVSVRLVVWIFTDDEEGL